MQCTGRATQRLPLSPLDITTLFFVPNSLAVYGLWWEKPADVQVPTSICIDDRTDEESRELLGKDALKWNGALSSLGGKDINELHSLFNNSDLPSGVVAGSASNAVTAVTMIDGALHCLAWNHDLPTQVERIL